MIKRLLRTTGALVAIVAAVQTAKATDLPMRAPPAAQIMSPISVYNWTGIYVGLNGGYGFGTQDPLALFSSNFNKFEYSANGWLAGGTMGAQIQSGHTVMGLEGDLDWASIKGSKSGTVTGPFGLFAGTATLSSKVSAISTIRARVGYAQDNWLLYGTLGAAVTDATSTFSNTVGFVCGGAVIPCTSPTSWHFGLAAGTGIEYGFTPNLSTKLEYLWVGAGAGNTLKESMVRFGLNYRFGQ